MSETVKGVWLLLLLWFRNWFFHNFSSRFPLHLRVSLHHHHAWCGSRGLIL